VPCVGHKDDESQANDDHFLTSCVNLLTFFSVAVVVFVTCCWWYCRNKSTISVGNFCVKKWNSPSVVDCSEHYQRIIRLAEVAVQFLLSQPWWLEIVATRHVYWSLNIVRVCMMYVCQCWFAHSLRKFAVHDWSIEQKWMTLLLPLLLLYNSKSVNDLTLGEFWERLLTTRHYVLCSMSVTSWSEWQNRSSWFLSQRLTWKGIGCL